MDLLVTVVEYKILYIYKLYEIIEFVIENFTTKQTT